MSFQQGVTGLNSAGRNLDVIGNNVANASTVGAKSSRAEFADIYARASGDSGAVGLGVSVAAVAQQFKQGSVTATDNPLDVAINGEGFFQLTDADGAAFYTRNGQFKVDREGYVVNAQGMNLLAIPTTYNDGQIPGKAVPLQLPTTGIAPAQTSQIGLELNLDSRAVTPTDSSGNPLTTVSFTDAKTYNNTTSMKVYDEKGQAVTLTYFFQKAGNDTWNIYAAANGESVLEDASTGNPLPITTLSFPSDGSAPTSPVSPLGLIIPATGAGTSAETVQIGTLTTPIELDLSSITQFGASFSPTALTQDGSAPGLLAGINIQDDGLVVATYSTGQSAPIARVELANFRNAQGLQPLGGNMWASTYASGDPVSGTPGSGSLGLLDSRAVEESNVDLTQELVNMMVAQRIYQANAQTIKTQDSVMQTLVSLR
ncbi:MAG: flagellar hook protein FlgE [Burkholderiaceae bacterium]|nr:flagellar hook protein FlgE [Burkholderiaceae bacterium]